MLKLNTPTHSVVHAAFVLPASPGMKPNGLVLAETDHDWVTWQIFWDGDTTGDEQGQTHEQWQCETGHYFQKSMTPSMGNPQRMAEHDFGLRLRRLLREDIARGVNERFIG